MRREALEKLPIYKKANEIYDICMKFTDLIIDEHHASDKIELQMLVETARHIRENAMIIPVKISGAEAVELYDIKMENAAIIRKCAREIRTNTFSFGMLEHLELDYIKLIRNEIEEFRILFAEWVKTFDQWNYIIDRWGLFNPPGIEYDDHDPDDDLPFNPDDFFEDL